jgi:hypothetical protein
VPAAVKGVAAVAALAGAAFGGKVYAPLSHALREWADPGLQYVFALALVGLAVVVVGLPVMQAFGRLGLLRPAGDEGFLAGEWGAVGEWLAAWLIGAPLLGGIAAVIVWVVLGLVVILPMKLLGGGAPPMEPFIGATQGFLVGGAVGLYGHRKPRIRSRKKQPPW